MVSRKARGGPEELVCWENARPRPIERTARRGDVGCYGGRIDGGAGSSDSCVLVALTPIIFNSKPESEEGKERDHLKDQADFGQGVDDEAARLSCALSVTLLPCPAEDNHALL